MSMSQPHGHRFAFPALIFASCALPLGPWLVRLAGVGPVAAGFWRLALALPFLFAHRAGDRSAGALARAHAGAPDRARRLVLRRRPRRLARRNPHDQARQRDLVRQLVELHVRDLGPVAGAAAGRGRRSASHCCRGGAALLIGNSCELVRANFTGDLLALFAGLFYTGYLIAVRSARGAMQPCRCSPSRPRPGAADAPLCACCSASR